jgi:hypothetical protein
MVNCSVGFRLQCKAETAKAEAAKAEAAKAEAAKADRNAAVYFAALTLGLSPDAADHLSRQFRDHGTFVDAEPGHAGGIMLTIADAGDLFIVSANSNGKVTGCTPLPK